jgi:hypothetical protein
MKKDNKLRNFRSCLKGIVPKNISYKRFKFRENRKNVIHNSLRHRKELYRINDDCN